MTNIFKSRILFRLFYFWLVLFQYTSVVAASLPVDASYIVVDLKYNEERGAQICEIQQGAPSAFKGQAMFYEGSDLIAYKLIDILSSFFEKSWTTTIHFADPALNKLLSINPRWTKVSELTDFEQDQEFLSKSSLTVKDPTNIRAYHGFVFLSPKIKMDRDKFQKKYPGVILTDNAFYNYACNKHKMTKLLMEHPYTKQHKPKWGLYNRNDENLADRINSEIGSDMLVIKPMNESRGVGVIILRKEELQDVLQCIFNRKNTGVYGKDPAYTYWKKSRNQEFLVEEFINADPVFVPHLDGKPYCPTLRFAFLLLYDQNKIEIITLGGYYTLPKVSLSEEGPLNEQYKSYVYPPYFAKADPEILDAAEVQVKKVLEIIYQRLLGIGHL
jgi:hypothetical protein